MQRMRRLETKPKAECMEWLIVSDSRP